MAYAASSQVFPINIRPSHTNTNTNTNTGCCVFVFHISLAAASSSQVFPINIGLSHLSEQIFFCRNFCSNFNKKVGHLQTMFIFRSESGWSNYLAAFVWLLSTVCFHVLCVCHQIIMFAWNNCVEFSGVWVAEVESLRGVMEDEPIHCFEMEQTNVFFSICLDLHPLFRDGTAFYS